MKPLDTDALAKQDIVARPEVTGGDDAPAPPAATKAAKAGGKSAKPAASDDADLEPTRLEKAAGAIMAEAIDDIRLIFGGGDNKNLPVLMTELFNGGFSALRALSGRAWVPFAVAGAALGMYMLPPFLRHLMGPKEGEDKPK